MEKIVKILSGLVAIIFILIGMQWAFLPAQAAVPLGYDVPTGLGLSSMLADVGGFFLGGGVMIVVGLSTKQAPWLQSAALLVALAALLRVVAWGLHDAPFATQFILTEVLMTAVLLITAKYITKSS